MSGAVSTIVRKILQNKLIFAMAVIGILAVFFGGAKLQDDSSSSNDPDSSNGSATTDQPSNTTTTTVTTGGLQPSLAVDFVKWWMGKAFDCSPQTANQNHLEAGGWMTPAAVNTYNTVFWNSPLAKSVVAGQIQAQFVPETVIALAANPDGTIVVGVRAYVQYNNGGAPVTEKLRTDFLVMRNTDGLRIAGIYNHPATATMTTSAPAG